jgi:dolichyl-diphosphooligosaccharide--protein glycosyltransferase/undecaprenyl-diphosphooligosaccharide--protein glycosyltransferase
MTLTTNKKIALLILIAFAFSFAVRLIWVQQFSDTEQFKFNGEFMINTNDGYFYAEGARDILAGITTKEQTNNDLSPVESAASILTAWIAKIVPFSFETVIFYMPAFFSSLLVIPIILIAREFERLEVGFIAALIGSIAWSYYNRTMVGYYDTDLLNIVLPTFLLWSLIWAIQTNKNIFLLITAIDILIYRWWYPQSVALEFAFVGLISLYGMYQFFKYKKDSANEELNNSLIYTLKLISIMLIAMMMVDGYIRIVLLAVLLYLFSNKNFDKYIYYILGISAIAFLSTGGIQLIWGKLSAYVFKDSIKATVDGLGLHFFTVMQTVREAGQIPFETFANRISGHTITFILAVIGYLWMTWNYRVMLLALPMVGLGFLALSGGLRFTVYAVPIMALGIGYLIVEVSKFLSSQLINDTATKVSKYVLMTAFTVGALYPNIIHVIWYKVPTVFNANEVKILDKMKSISDREDYFVTWWDYGYPIRYYSDVKTLIDGGKHSGKVNFPVSFVLNEPQDVAAKMARLDVEYTEKRFHLDNTTKWASSNIEQITLDYGYKNTNDFLTSLSTDIKMPKKTRDIYLYLPNRMMGIFPTVTLFSNIDLMSGTKGARPFFYKSNSIKDTGTTIELGKNIRIIKAKGQIQIGNQTLTINNFAVTQYDNKGVLRKQIQTIDKNSPISVIYMKNYNQFLVLDKKMYNSTYIQLFALENYDKELYEPVILDPLSKIYRLKI